MSCRKNKLRLWQHRIMLESLKHKDSCMITLTYDEEHLPPGGSLQPKDLQDFLKRFRRAVEPTKIRFYAVGEYGEKSHRPHYHIAVFGFPHCEDPNYQRRTRKPCPCRRCVLVRSTWGKGIVDLGFSSITKDSAQYVAGYVTKKLTNGKDKKVKEILNGRHPEFSRMSLKPGIGAGIVEDIVETLTTNAGAESICRTGDVPISINHGGRSWPLGRYLRTLIRARLGFHEVGAQPGWEKQVRERAEEEMLELCISEGLIGLIEKEEDSSLQKKTKRGMRRDLLANKNIEVNRLLEQKEAIQKMKGRKV